VDSRLSPPRVVQNFVSAVQCLRYVADVTAMWLGVCGRTREGVASIHWCACLTSHDASSTIRLLIKSMQACSSTFGTNQ